MSDTVYTSCGKQVLANGIHFADAVSPSVAEQIAAVFNGSHARDVLETIVEGRELPFPYLAEPLGRIATDNNLSRIEINYNQIGGGSTFGTVFFAPDLGQHGCLFGYGDTAEEAILNAVDLAAEQRAMRNPDILGEAA